MAEFSDSKSKIKRGEYFKSITIPAQIDKSKSEINPKIDSLIKRINDLLDE